LNTVGFEKLVGIMATLRSPGGCPWDREQTHKSLKPYLLEEAYEVLEALDEEDFSGLQEELGDLLLQVIFHAQIAAEEGRFTIDDVIDSINTKLTRRHPHVFGSADIKTSDEQRIHWEKLKKVERKTSVLDGVPRNLPALLRAMRIQQKASTVGFDWNEAEDAWKKVEEEMAELQIAQDESREKVEEDFGDLLFALVNYARFLQVNPEDTLRSAVEKFIDRFKKVEKAIESGGKRMEEASLDEMDAVWNTIKNQKKKREQNKS
jgi:tetrapyrrole methylase family protein/MazG family protein